MNTPMLLKKNEFTKNLAKTLINGFPWSNLKGSKNGIRTCWVEVTPEIAAAILDQLNENNRPISPTLVDKYAIDMENGTWGQGESNICISITHRLLNGQHRLAAVIKSGKTIGFMFAFGLPNSEFMNMDSGKKRSVATKLILGGVVTKNATQVSATATLLFEHMKGGLGGYSSSPTDDELYNCAKKWVKEFQESIGWVKSNLKRYKILKCDASFAHFCILHGNFKKEGREFLAQLTSYINGDISKFDLTKTGDDSHPIVALTDQFIKELGWRAQDTHHTRLDKGVHIMEAFDKYVKGEKFRVFKWTNWPDKSVIGSFDIA